MNKNNKPIHILNRNQIAVALLTCAMVTTMGFASLSNASSHKESPMLIGDPRADATDLYAFRNKTNNANVTFIANYVPFQEPAGGPNFYSFDDNVRYDINIDNDGDAVADIVYRYDFDSSYQNDDTHLYATGPVTSLTDTDLNYRQTYSLTKIKNGSSTVLATGVPVPPSNIGPKTMPEGYANLQAASIADIGNGGKAFAGQSEDSFFADIGAIFDLLNIRNLPGDTKGGIDTLAGFNVLSLVLDVPISDVTASGTQPTLATDPNAVIGVWTTSARQTTRVLKTDGSADFSGAWVQVSRLGQPLVNEVVIPIGMKDRFNASQPSGDTQFANYVANPEVPQILNALFGITVPPQGDFGTTNQRDDLIAIFLTGLSGINQPLNVTPSEQLRLNVATPVTVNPNRLGVIGGDTQGFPNGRRLGDDVIDIAFRVMAGAAYPLFHPTYTPDATGIRLGDGVDVNDASYRTSFPFVGLPYQGYLSVPHKNGATVPNDDDDDDDGTDDDDDETDDDDDGTPSEKVQEAIEKIEERIQTNKNLPTNLKTRFEAQIEKLRARF